MIITHKLQPMDLTHKQNTSRVDVVQDDKYSRDVEFTLTENGVAWQIPDGTTAVVRYKKPDGTGGNYDTMPGGSTAYQINGNVLTVALAPQVCTVPGQVQLSVGLIQGNAEINTFSVNIVVQPNPGATYQSEDYIKLSGAVPNSGWTPNMYLGTDASGNVVAKDGTSGGGGTVSVDSTLTKSGQAADAAVVGQKFSELSEEITNIGSSNSGSVCIDYTYRLEDIGELYAAPSDYSAWCPGNLRWDGNLQKFVSLIYAAPAHVHSTSDLYVSYIDQESFSATKPEKCRYVDTDGETDITPDNAGTCSFLILSDGSYLMIHLAADGNTYKFTSTDNGVTWKKVSVVTGYSGSPWNMTELSNGRIIVSDDASKVGFYYSDDGGITFTQVIPGTCGGGYEAEACILEVQPGKLIAIARYSMSGKGYYESGDSEAAIFASSDDYGTTWSNWKISGTIDNMNASSCTGVVHDGIVEIFTASRWYSNGGNVNTDNVNTGKNGAMMHYMATVKNALSDNFTKVGIVDYARGTSGEYHAPCAAIDGNKRLLIVHMDGGEAATCNNRYLRGGIGNISYACTDNSASTVKAFSAAMVTKLLAEKQDSINYLQMALSKIEGSGVTPPSGIEVLVAQYVAADMASSLIYPWSSGSDFNGNSGAQYAVDTGATSKVHEFLVDDSGETYLKTYGCVVRPIKSENATDCYIKVEWNSRTHVKTHCILNGYITVADIQNGTLVSLSTSGYIEIKESVPEATTLEVHDGYCILDGTKYELPRVTVDDFLTNYTGYTYFARHGRITELSPAGDVDIVTTSDQCGVLLEVYHNIYSIKYYETY